MNRTKDLSATGLLNYDQAAQYTGYHRSTLAGYVNCRSLRATVVGGKPYFRKSALDQWLSERKYRRGRKPTHDAEAFTTAAEMARSFGVTRPTVNAWGRKWLAPAKAGREGRTDLYLRDAAERLFRRHRRVRNCLAEPRREPEPERPAGLLFGVEEVAGFLGLRPSTVAARIADFAPAVEVRGYGTVEDIYSAERVRRIRDEHLRRSGERRVSARLARWDGVCRVPPGAVRGSRAAASAAGMDRRTFMRNYAIFEPALVCEAGGVRCYDPDRLREIWAARIEDNRWRSSETLRRTVARSRPAVIPEGTALGIRALADAVGCHPHTVSDHMDEFRRARLSRHGQTWLYDVAVAEGIMARIRERQKEARRAGQERYWKSRRLGLYTQSQNGKAREPAGKEAGHWDTERY